MTAFGITTSQCGAGGPRRRVAPSSQLESFWSDVDTIDIANVNISFERGHLHTAAKIPVLAMFASLRIAAQAPLNPEQAATVAVAERAAMAAITFRQGDAAGFGRARFDFTPDGWSIS